MLAKNVVIMPSIEVAEAKTRAAAYVRVSTKSFVQEESFVFQKCYWEQKLSALPSHEIVGIYTDTISGYYDKRRTGFSKLISDALEGKIDIIYTKSISRFCRNMPLLIETLRMLSNKRIAVFFEKEGINSLDTKQSLVLQLQATLAENEIKNNKTLVEKSRRQQFAEGRPYMCLMPYGYRQDCRPEFVIDETEAPHIRTMFEMYDSGAGYRKIAKHLNDLEIRTRAGSAWNDGTIKRMLQNEKYVGDCLLQKSYRDENHITRKNNGEVKAYYIENNHEGIVSRDVWDRVQARLNAQKEAFANCLAYRPLPSEIITEPQSQGLSGKLICAECGANYKIRRDYSGSKLRRYYRCNKTKPNGCNSRAVLACIITYYAWDAYREYLEKAEEQVGKLESYLTEILAEQSSLIALKNGRYISYESYQKELKHITDELKRVDESIRKKESVKTGGYEEHIEKIVVGNGTTAYHFIDGQIIVRGQTL